MSDTQPIKNPSDEVEITGGWKKPEKTGGWKVPQRETGDSQTSGWRVPAMPPELDETPAREGTWHLPRPEDTRFGPEDEVEISTAPAIALRPEDVMFDEPAEEDEETAEAIGAGTADDEDTGDLEAYTGLGDLVASLTSLMEAQPKPEILPGADEDEDTAQAVEVEDASDDFGPALAEREALSQALGTETTEVHPADYARQRVDWLAAEPEEEVETEDAALDPGAYARQQLEALQSGQEPQAPVTEPAPSDPAAYARQQLAQLGGTGGVSTTEPELADPAQVELTRKFQETERRVRALRQQYQGGLITRDQLQEELRKQLILDTDDNWWMMGIETDTWFRYDDASQQWVVDKPPVMPGRGLPTETSQFTPDQVLQGQLPYLPDDAEITEATEDTALTGGTEPIYLEPDMPLPRTGVPINDPNATIPGQAAINQNTVRMSDAQTVSSGWGADATIRATPVETTPYEPATAYDTLGAAAIEPPTYDDLDEETRAYQQAVERQRQSTLRRVILVATLFIGGAFIIGTLMVLYTVISYNGIASQYTAQIAALANYEPDFETVRVLDAAGNLLAELNSEQGGSRESVTLGQMSSELIFAIVGAQDPRYYETSGFDLVTIADAFLQNLRGSASRGLDVPRTITQEIAYQLVVANSANSASATRLDIIVAASEIARKYDKNFILELYLNEQFFGNQSYGVQAASEFYFDKPASQVNLVEGAMLASLLRDPVDHDPVPKENRDRAFVAADAVLRELASVGCLNFQHAQFRTSSSGFCVQSSQILRPSGDFTANVNLQRAELQTLPFTPRGAQGRYPHFVDYIRRELTREFGDEMFRRGFEVRTTLRADIQDTAQQALREQLRTQAFTGLQTGAVVVVNPSTGEILAMVGSHNFNDSDLDGQTNYAFTWQLPGATMLPIAYAKALEGIGDVNQNGQVNYDEYLTAATVLFDVPRDFQDPRLAVSNADNQFRGAVSLRQALANSINVPSMKVFNYIGSERYIEIARRMGLTFTSEPPVIDARTGIGEVTEVRLWDMMKAYSALANTGQYAPMRAISEIRDSDNQVVALPETLAPRQATPVIAAPIAFLLQNILSDSQFYDQSFAALFLPNYPGRTAVKINHINDNRDMWAIGFSRNAVVGVWMGRPDNATTNANSRDAALPVWKAVIERVMAGSNPAPFTTPGNQVQAGSVQSIVICAPTGNLPGEGCTQQRNEYFAITNPPAPADQGPVVRAVIDSWTRLIANDFCRDNVIEDQFVQLVPADPGAIAWLGSTGGRATANRMGLPQNVQPLPTAACDLNTDLPTARITSPAENTAVTGNVSILGVATANNFASYQLSYAPVGTSNFTLITGPIGTQQPNQNGTLGQWNTVGVTNGQYTLRLTMNSRTGGSVNRDILITVLNPTPTPQPIPTATSIPIPIATPTTIPIFPSPAIAQPESFGAPTPTATLVIGG